MDSVHPLSFAFNANRLYGTSVDVDFRFRFDNSCTLVVDIQYSESALPWSQGFSKTIQLSRGRSPNAD